MRSAYQTSPGNILVSKHIERRKRRNRTLIIAVSVTCLLVAGVVTALLLLKTKDTKQPPIDEGDFNGTTISEDLTRSTPTTVDVTGSPTVDPDTPKTSTSTRRPRPTSRWTRRTSTTGKSTTAAASSHVITSATDSTDSTATTLETTTQEAITDKSITEELRTNSAVETEPSTMMTETGAEPTEEDTETNDVTWTESGSTVSTVEPTETTVDGASETPIDSPESLPHLISEAHSQSDALSRDLNSLKETIDDFQSKFGEIQSKLLSLQVLLDQVRNITIT